MDNITIAPICGLCAGCKNAIKCATDAIKKNANVFLFKEIVHNENVNSHLKSLGIGIKHSLDEFNLGDTIIIRAHGEPPETYEYLNRHNISYIDCTCVNVKQIHDFVNKYSANGFTNIIIGKYGRNNSKMHPEIAGTIGWSKTPVILIETEEDCEKLRDAKNQKFYLTCQTTFNENNAKNLIQKIELLLSKNNNELVVNFSVCGAGKAINLSSSELAKKVDLMLVVGSKTSSNTTELYNNLSKICKTIFIDNTENWKELVEKENITLTKEIKIGITAGASTDPEELKNLKNKIEGEICQTI